MRRRLYQALGRASLVLDPLSPPAGRAGHPVPGRDRTGLLVREAKPLPVLRADDEILYVRYPSFAHSFWRAQELSLFRQHTGRLPRPWLDFGCGDGSFAAALFAQVDIGVDTDADALDLARGWGVYGRLVQCTNDRIPLPDRGVRSVFANSVLEHVAHLDPILAELARVLEPGGVLAFTVPLLRYAEQLRYFFGAAASERINRESSHRNLLSEDAWLETVARHGFRPVVVRQYQPDWFTFWYRMFRLLGPGGLGRVPGVPAGVWRLAGGRLVRMVRQSVRQTVHGANLFVMADRLAGVAT